MKPGPTEQDTLKVEPLAESAGQRLPLHAFGLLETGDGFEVAGGVPPKDGRARAEAWVTKRVVVRANGAPQELVKVVQDEMVRQVLGNPQLVARLEAARSIEVDVVPERKTMAHFGFPKAASARAAGLFWDHPSWPVARIGLLARALESERVLVVHELAHAIFRLAFTRDEQERIYRLLLPVYRSRAWVDEAFAIYSEREFVPKFTDREDHAPGVYGLVRRRWDERHVFTRFVRALYHPHKPFAGSVRRDHRGLLG